MGGQARWIAHAFRMFEALINPRRPLQPDRPVATATDEGLAPAAPAVDAAASIPALEPASAADALVPHDELKVETGPVEPIAPPLETDDESRRQLIRQLFNEYWTGLDDKPPTFAERLAIAERYINERLADREVGWRLDAVTRKQLGLPSNAR